MSDTLYKIIKIRLGLTNKADITGEWHHPALLLSDQPPPDSPLLQQCPTAPRLPSKASTWRPTQCQSPPKRRFGQNQASEASNS